MEIKSLNGLHELIEKTKQKYVGIETQEHKNAPIKASKMGGIPYWPKSKPLPKINGKSIKLIAQLNFEEIAVVDVYLKGFPKIGIIQFFCEYNDDMWGLTFNGEKNNTLAVYHENISEPFLMDDELIAISEDDSVTPYYHESIFKFSEKEESLGLIDEYSCNKYYDFKVDDLSEDLIDYMYENLTNSGSKVGGYAYFTQSDPRSSETNDDWVLLLQLDTDENMMWGDCGVANWFIKRKDLLAKDFSNVLFNWDCC